MILDKLLDVFACIIAILMRCDIGVAGQWQQLELVTVGFSMAETAEPKRILVADDDTVFREVAAACLRNAGYEVRLASQGAEAMTMLLQENFDLAIIDLLMPQIDGLRLIALMRATPQLRDLPVLIITSQQDPTVRADGMQVGANDYLTKPVDWARLPQRVGALIEDRVSERLEA